MIYEKIDHENKARILCYTVRAWKQMPHFHREYEIVCMLTGEVNILYRGRIHTIHRNDIFIVESNELHDVFSNDPTNAILVLQIKPDFFTIFCPILSDMHLSRHFLLDPEEAIHQKLRHCIVKIIECYRESSPSRSFHLIQIGCEILILLIKHFRLDYPKNSQNSKSDDLNVRLSRMLKYIDDHANGKVTLQEIADREAVSLNYLSSFFHVRMGMTFQEYVTRLRLRNAVFMIVNTDKNLTTISSECGFSDPRYLKRAFEAEYGKSLSEFLESRHDPADYLPDPLSIGSNNPVSISADEILQLLKSNLQQSEKE